MPIDSSFSSLLHNLKVDDPWLPPNSWESIPSESGSTHSIKPAQNPIFSTNAPESISEMGLVRLAINALQGVKSAIVQIDKISNALCEMSADRTVHQVQTLWYRTSSGNALGSMLKSISHSGHVVFFVREFVKYCYGSSCSLVNQAFSVAVGKVLDGYVCALNTLLVSVKMRRGAKCDGGLGILTSVVSEEVTLLEVYLHSEELRIHIEALGNVCLMKDVDLNVESGFEFSGFPRGAELLTYLYVLLRDADPGHHAFLKFLFIQSCEPYYTFIKSWIYHAKIDDPYGEFFVGHIPSDSIAKTDYTGGFSISSIKERDCPTVPCFLKDVCRPLIRAGQQLEVLVKLLNICSFSAIEDCKSCKLAKLEDILPFWAQPKDPAALLNETNFNTKGIQMLVRNREIIYEAVLEKLQKFFTNLDIKCQKMSHYGIPIGNLLERKMGVSLILDGNLDHISLTNEQGAIRADADHGDTNATIFDESSSDMELSQSSESCSSYSCEEEFESEAVSELPNVSNQETEFLFSNLCNAKKKLLKNDKKGKYYLKNKCEAMDRTQSYENENFDLMPVTHKSDASKCVRLSDTFDEKIMSGKCWPLGALLKNPFYDDEKREVLEEEETETDFSEMFVKFSSHLDSIGKTQYINESDNQTWNSSDRYDLSVNPILSKTAWLRTVRTVRDRVCLKNFDFSSVLDPCKSYTDMLVASQDDKSQSKIPKKMASNPDVGANEDSSYRVKEYTTDPSVIGSICPSKVVYGGSEWERSLMYSKEEASFCAVDTRFDSVEIFETPLDVLVDKSIRQEILIQYKYVSNFAIKLLKDGFNFHEHLVALRRYYFMEQADWADPFITSLNNQKWSIIEPEQKIAKIQNLLKFALERSSCENDPYKERLFVGAKAKSMVSEPTSSVGLYAFEFMVLGYRVDWPVNIIITLDALKAYAEIFNYLIKIRLAVISLTDVWYWLKEEVNLTKHIQSGVSHKVDFATLMKMRQNIYHFVHTLQEYVHSHLADISWSQFQHSLHHGVKDMLDLKSVHTSYLANAMHICFLSDETKSVAAIINNILQCGLDFRVCFPGSDNKHLDLCHQLNFTQISSVKATFDRNIRDLYTLYLKSPKHGEFSLCPFWSYLNYNDFYSTAITKEMGYLYH